MEEKSIKSATYSLPRVHFNGLAWFQRQKSSEHEVTEVVNIKLYGWWFSWKKVALVFSHHYTRGNEQWREKAKQFEYKCFQFQNWYWKHQTDFRVGGSLATICSNSHISWQSRVAFDWEPEEKHMQTACKRHQRKTNPQSSGCDVTVLTITAESPMSALFDSHFILYFSFFLTAAHCPTAAMGLVKSQVFPLSCVSGCLLFSLNSPALHTWERWKLIGWEDGNIWLWRRIIYGCTFSYTLFSKRGLTHGW